MSSRNSNLRLTSVVRWKTSNRNLMEKSYEKLPINKFSLKTYLFNVSCPNVDNSYFRIGNIELGYFQKIKNNWLKWDLSHLDLKSDATSIGQLFYSTKERGENFVQKEFSGWEFRVESQTWGIIKNPLWCIFTSG